MAKPTREEAVYVAMTASFTALAGLLIDKGIISRSECGGRLRDAAAETAKSEAGLLAAELVLQVANLLDPQTRTSPS